MQTRSRGESLLAEAKRGDGRAHEEGEVRAIDGGSGASWFVAIELSEPAEMPGMVLPLAGAGTSSGLVAAEVASVTGFACTPTWTIYLWLEVPEDCWDAFDTDHENGPCTIFATLAESGTRFAALALESGRIVLRMPTGEQISLGNSTGLGQLRPFKASPVLVAVTCGLDKYGDLRLTLAASVSGSEIVIGSSEVLEEYFQPVAILWGDPKQESFASMFVWGGAILEDDPSSEDDLASNLRAFDFLIED